MQIQFAKVIECADPGTDELLITGVAVRYDSIGHPSDGVPTVIRAGALQGLDSVTLDMYHNRGRLIARSPRTMQFIDGPKELRLKANPVRTREAEDAVELIRAGVITGLSIDARANQARDEGQYPCDRGSRTRFHRTRRSPRVQRHPRDGSRA